MALRLEAQMSLSPSQKTTWQANNRTGNQKRDPHRHPKKWLHPVRFTPRVRSCLLSSSATRLFQRALIVLDRARTDVAHPPFFFSTPSLWILLSHLKYLSPQSSVRGVTRIQDLPPAKGFNPITYRRNIPNRGFGPYTLIGFSAFALVYGFYKIGEGNLERRWVQQRSRQLLASNEKNGNGGAILFPLKAKMSKCGFAF